MSANLDDSDGFKPKSRGVAMNLTYKGVPTNEYDTGRDEKPWQRVLYTLSKKGKHLYEPVVSVPSTLILILLGWYLLLGYLTQLVEDGMPRVINETNIARDNTDTFSEDLAWSYLNSILGDEPRVGGTAYHLKKTADIKAMVDDIARRATQRVTTDWQIVSGDYIMVSNPSFVNIYENASNVIAVLEGDSGYHPNGTIGTSILLNCHYDSVPFAMGASDNAVFCAIMMELLQKLSRRTTKFKHNIVFLFNGAEELGLLASHGFLKHPWAAGVTAVVNLDSAGMNGKPSIFQVTDPRVLRAYSRVVGRPSAQGLGEVLFSTGVIPSDTDFRIFRDFAGIQGIDIAFTKWGHVYHTRYDHPSMILPGVIQNAGNTLLALTIELADLDELNTKLVPTTAVYSDFLNWFMVSLPLGGAYAADAVIAGLAVASAAYYVWLVGPRWSTVRELLLAALGRVLSMVAGAALACVLAAITIATTIQLRYLSQPWIVVPMFWVPYTVGAVAASQAYDAWRTKKSGLNRSIRTLQAMTATRLLLLACLLVLMAVPPLQSARYLVSTPLLFLTVTGSIAITLVRYLRLQAWQHLLLELSLSLPLVMWLLSLSLRMDAMMLPIMGRTPSDSPDWIVGLINIGLAITVVASVSGIELLFSRRLLWLPLGVALAASIVIMFIPFAPFKDDGPATQRHYWFHTEIVTYDFSRRPTEVTTGVAVMKLDSLTRSSLAPLLRARTSTDRHDCGTTVYCNLPLYRPSFGKHLHEAVFIDMSGPSPLSPAPAVTSSRSCQGDVCTYYMQMTGAAHNTVTLWPKEHVNVTSWSLSAPLRSSFHQGGRPVFVLIHALATYNEMIQPFNFSFTCTIPSAQQFEPAVEVSHHAHKLYHPQDFTPAYRALLNEAPKYFNVATFLTYRHNYVF